MNPVVDAEASSIQTRPSLLRRLQSDAHPESWTEFFGVYGKLIRDFALHAGLDPVEAEDVVQDTAIALARHLPDFRYDPKVCRFKSWLLTQSSWRIKDRFRRRSREARLPNVPILPPSSRDAGGTFATRAAIENIPDPSPPDLDALFEEEWRRTLFNRALERVKERFTLKQFQIFDLVVFKHWKAGDVARSLQVSTANVYVIRHRISAAIKKETLRLQSELQDALAEASPVESRKAPAEQARLVT